MPADRSNGKTECIYEPRTEAIRPYVEFSVAWGDGAAAMAGVGMIARAEPGIANPYDGLGDQAVVVGPALMIRTGKNLVTIVLSGVDEAPAKARRSPMPRRPGCDHTHLAARMCTGRAGIGCRSG